MEEKDVNATGAEILDKIRQMEGAENNAYVMRLLGDVFTQIAAAHPGASNTFIVTMKVLEDIRATAWKNLENLQKLPQEEQHYLFHGELSAQDTFVKFVVDAFTADNLTDEERVAQVLARVDEHATEAEAAVAQPLAELREIIDLMMELKGATIH